MTPPDIKPRVLFVVRSLHVGGMERMVIELAIAVRDRGFDVRFCTIEDAGQLSDQLGAAGIGLVELRKPPGLSLSAVVSLRALINDWRPDIIHTHNDTGHFYASLANCARWRPVTLIHTKHGRGDPENGRSVTRNNLSSRLSDVVVAVSTDVEAVCRDVENVSNDKLLTIVNGLDLQPFLKIEPRPASSERIVFGHVGRLSEVKNQALMLRAFADVRSQVPGAELVIAGDGPLAESLRKEADDLDVSGAVRFLGYRSDVDQVLSGIDVFLLSSVSEGTPLVVIEAMAAGLPVIATDVGGLSSMVEPGNTGQLVPSRDRAAMAAAMVELANDAGTRRRMGDQARSQAADHYGLDRMVDEYERLYRSRLAND